MAPTASRSYFVSSPFFFFSAVSMLIAFLQAPASLCRLRLTASCGWATRTPSTSHRFSFFPLLFLFLFLFFFLFVLLSALIDNSCLPLAGSASASFFPFPFSFSFLFLSTSRKIQRLPVFFFFLSFFLFCSCLFLFVSLPALIDKNICLNSAPSSLSSRPRHSLLSFFLVFFSLTAPCPLQVQSLSLQVKSNSASSYTGLQIVWWNTVTGYSNAVGLFSFLLASAESGRSSDIDSFVPVFLLLIAYGDAFRGSNRNRA